MEYELNIFDPEVKRDPYRHYEALHEIGPVVQNTAMFGMPMVVGYEAVNAILKDGVRFSAQRPPGMEDRVQAFEAPIMLTTDPPDHERLRGVVSRAFTPRAVAGLEPHIRELATALLAPLRDGETFDVATQLSAQLPVIVIAEMLGVSPEDRTLFKQWSDDLIGGSNEMATEDEVAAARDGAANLREYFREEIARRRQHAQDDLVGRLIAANEGSILSDAELLASCVLLLVAGNETTTNLITNGTLAFARNPDQRRRVVDEPGLMASAVEEAVRYDAPVQATSRLTTEDLEVAGYPMPAGTPVMVLLAAANNDPNQFPSPRAFDVGRNPNPHLGFGFGLHFCLGAGLARLEARVALEMLLDAAPEFALADPDGPLVYGPSFFFHSPHHLPITK